MMHTEGFVASHTKERRPPFTVYRPDARLPGGKYISDCADGQIVKWKGKQQRHRSCTNLCGIDVYVYLYVQSILLRQPMPTDSLSIIEIAITGPALLPEQTGHASDDWTHAGLMSKTLETPGIRT